MFEARHQIADDWLKITQPFLYDGTPFGISMGHIFTVVYYSKRNVYCSSTD
jgi:hypothetical protein